MPNVGQQVIVTLDTGDEVWACWSGLDWYVELDDDAGIAPLSGIVVSWSLD
jgi:hypothetical protein